MSDNTLNQKVSIIIPVYNVSEYLERCLNSILNQTYDNIEIVLIDDKSTDNTLSMCLSFSEKYDTVKVIALEENSGAAAARVAGINAASGSLYMFADGDDWLHPKMVEQMVLAVCKYGVDVFQCGQFIVESFNRDFDDIDFDSYKVSVFNSNEAIRQLYGASDVSGYNYLLWNKIYSENVIKNTVLPTDNLKINDVPFIPRLLSNAKTAAISEVPLYYYFQRNNSNNESTMDATKSDYFKMSYEHFKAFKNVSDYFKNQNNKELYLLTSKYTLIYSLSVLKAKNATKQAKKQAISAVKSIPTKSYKYLPLKKALLCRLFKIFG